MQLSVRERERKTRVFCWVKKLEQTGEKDDSKGRVVLIILWLCLWRERERKRGREGRGGERKRVEMVGGTNTEIGRAHV